MKNDDRKVFILKEPERRSFFIFFRLIILSFASMILSYGGFCVFLLSFTSIINTQDIQVANAQVVSTQAFEFTKNLSIRESGPDVLVLQKVLNSDPDTIVATSGPGSSGMETQYFGQATKKAVILFQNKYLSDIIVPAGLTQGNGFVGQLTRAKLNQIYYKVYYSYSTASPSSIPQPQTDVSNIKSNGITNNGKDTGDSDPNISILRGLFSGNLSILSIIGQSSVVGTASSTLVLYGSGFTDTGNVIHFGDSYEIQDIPGIQQVKLSFSIPNDIPLGKYNIWVTNSSGSSGKDHFFVIINKATKAPVITSIDPGTGLLGTMVTIHGDNFSPSNNEVRSPYGVISGLRSTDGKTVVFGFSYPDFVKLQHLKDIGVNVADLNIPVSVGVVDDNGVTTGSAKFTLIIK